jgi:hypothetical protein
MELLKLGPSLQLLPIQTHKISQHGGASDVVLLTHKLSIELLWLTAVILLTLCRITQGLRAW